MRSTVCCFRALGLPRSFTSRGRPRLSLSPIRSIPSPVSGRGEGCPAAHRTLTPCAAAPSRGRGGGCGRGGRGPGFLGGRRAMAGQTSSRIPAGVSGGGLWSAASRRARGTSRRKPLHLHPRFTAPHRHAVTPGVHPFRPWVTHHPPHAAIASDTPMLHGPIWPLRLLQRAKYVACLPLSAASNVTAMGFFVNLPTNDALAGSV